MKDKQKSVLIKIMQPVMSNIKFAAILAGFAALCYVLAFGSFAFIISDLTKGEVNYTLISFALIFIFVEFFTRSNSFKISHVAAFKLEQILRTQISTHLAQIPFGKIITRGSGKLKKIMLDDVKNLHAFVADTTPMIGRIIVVPIASFIAIAILDMRLLGVIIAMFAISIIVMSFAFKDNAKYRNEYDENQNKINTSIIEFIQAMPVVRTFSDGKTSFKRYNESLDAYSKSLKEWIKLTTIASRIGFIVISPILTLVVLAISGSYFYLNDSLEFGRFIAILVLGVGIAESMMPLMFLNNFIQKSRAAASSILEILEIEPLKISNSTKTPLDSSIEFKNVSFKYENRDEFALCDINFKVESKTVTALVGPSGAGKSTAAQLIPRFWDVDKGKILIGGIDIKDMDYNVLNDTVSFVFQDTFLFNESIYENIAMAKPQASKDEVIKAAKAAQIHDFITSLPKQYDTLAGDRGASLSGGQRQRITIARAILRDAPIIILDEATAFADPENEEEIIKAISNLITNKTVIIIAHRLLSIQGADQIIVFDKGKIVEIGIHNELLKNKNLYSKLWENYTQTQIWNIYRGKKDEKQN
ncbi:ABC transporter, ATP-binding/permease components [Campylobacter blaseri]|uniref:ABC transporter ATP-binding protein/permease n=1 Tax=Campylobacter blaseri TaxID=2042961 RepID=A0A2P8R3Q9_9BACT|nr:ABC transporter ATP-binding protein [Campylobacter blaseri]PSM53137.1 ABC transporter ATP-binding protein/permease [Campylobacter blaseri]PSM54603.1 ABC transporter ATP-binding protein/permease [Campylobacter blaseri]QKF86924.1 ABC transporter, ATP-binding/permease components [Campylobacter blaseri]